MVLYLPGQCTLNTDDDDNGMIASYVAAINIIIFKQPTATGFSRPPIVDGAPSHIQSSQTRPLRMVGVPRYAPMGVLVAAAASCRGAVAFHPGIRLSPPPAVVRPRPKPWATAHLGRGQRQLVWLTTQIGDDGDAEPPGEGAGWKAPFRKAKAKFQARPGTYLMIPVIAAFVGWFTNYLAVQMIFYPIKFRGIPLYRRPEIPLGLLGWQGIVPCKTRKMSETMVNMVTTQLLDVTEVFRRLDPREVANLLAPEVPKLGQGVLEDAFPARLAEIPGKALARLPSETVDHLWRRNLDFLKGFTVAMQDNISSLLSIKNCVIDQMMQDRSMLGILFKKCGQAELNFLTNSGLWFGFLLGIIQMGVALLWDNQWTLSVGGLIVGLATNWLAIKWIFEPVNPTKVGPFVLQGMFLRRQKEVAEEFSSFFANRILTSEKLWQSILTDPETTPAFHRLFTEHLVRFGSGITGALRLGTDPAIMAAAAGRAIQRLPNHVHVLHSYVNQKLNLQESLRVSMEGMTSSQFERVLHPIFEEDELTLIIAGGALGLAAGLIQQGLETGTLTLPTWAEAKVFLLALPGRIRNFNPTRFASSVAQSSKARISRLFRYGSSKNGDEGKEADSDRP